MSQQRYIYPPQSIEGVEALYSSPNIGDGYTSVQQQITSFSIRLDRSVVDTLKLPYTGTSIELSPNELATSASIFNIINNLNYNFIYLNTRAVLISNVLPGNYRGFYTNTGDSPGLPIFKERADDPEVTSIPLTGISDGGNVEIDPTTPVLSNTLSGQDLDSLVDGVWIRDNTAIAKTYNESSRENWHVGFLVTPNSMTVVKMSNKPHNQTRPSYDQDGNISGSNGWVILDRYTTVEELPTDKNTMYYNNIVKVKASESKTLYVLDKGQPRAGVSKVSDSSQRSVIYRYNVTGYLNTKDKNSIEFGNRVLENILGDVNNRSNASDIVNPVAFTIDSQDNLIVYDEYDYTFKIFDKNNNFLRKYPKRNILFRGATGTTKQYTGISDIHYDVYTNQIYVLTPGGSVITLDDKFETLQQITVPKSNSNTGTSLTQLDLDADYYKTGQPGDAVNEKFLSMQFSRNEDNIYYILTNYRVIKRFKSRNFNIGVFNTLDNGIGIKVQQETGLGCRASLKFMSVSQEARVVTRQFTTDEGEVISIVDTDRSYTYDQIYLYTDFINIQKDGTKLATGADLNKKYLLSFEERINIRSNLSDTDYPIYQLSDTTSLSFKEYNSDFVYNKMLKKLISNHMEMIEKINYRLSAKYTTSGNLVYDKRVYLTEQEYRNLIVDDEDEGYFVGVNEYFSTGVLNRCFQKIFKLQKKILNVLEVIVTNSWPNQDLNVPVEPYLYTNGNEFNDIDGKPYTGYYYIREQPSGDIFVQGRTETDGTRLPDGTPTSDRFLSTIETG